MNLFVNGQLNYFEALRRMAHWIEEIDNHNDPGGHNIGRVRILRRLLVQHAMSNTLWIDPFYVDN
jgi:hypothetical protein